MARKVWACKTCGSVGQTGSAASGSCLIELVLWMCAIVPGVIYSLWRISSRKSKCKVCGSKELVPLDSPEGRRIRDTVPPPP